MQDENKRLIHAHPRKQATTVCDKPFNADLKRAFQFLAGMFLVPVVWGQGVPTWHNDLARTGQNLQETILSPSNVTSANFGLKFTLSLDGKVDGQPLYVPALSIAGGTHNVLYVVTENDTVYAFDADTAGAPLWSQSLLGSGERSSDSRDCSQILPTIGITSTPVIDLSIGPHGTIYVVAMSLKGADNTGNYYQRLHALDLTTGAEQTNWPITISATYQPGSGADSTNGVQIFDPKQYKERAALLISNGVIYTVWASHCDFDPYTGWVIGYNQETQAQTVLNLTPNGDKGAVWQSGAGPAADSSGNIYFLMGNGVFDTTLTPSGFPTGGDYGNAFMKLSTNSRLAVADYFTMYDQALENDPYDVDLGSGGPMLLGTLNDAMGNPHSLAVGAGKDGNAYVVDQNNMGKYRGSTNAIYQEFAIGGSSPVSVFSSPAWFNNTLYYGSTYPNTTQQLRAFRYSDGSFGSPFQTSLSSAFGYPGPTPSISGNGSANAIVWAVKTGSTSVLYAFNTSTLAELYDSDQAGARDNFGTSVNFPTPTVANGKVYVGTTTGVAAFGLLNCTYTVGTNSVAYDSAANSSSVNVTTESGCSWSVVNNSNFIVITGGATGTGSNAVAIQVPANTGAARSGTLIIAGRIVTITQSASAQIPAPSNPSPANGATGIAIAPTLSWTASTGATSYDVYFGTSANPSLATNTTSTSYAPGSLNPGSQYYWKVVAKNSGGSNSSAVWSFTTYSASVTVVSVTPSSGSGTSQTFAATFSDSGGASAITTAYLVIGSSTASGVGNCWLQFNASNNTYSLLNDAGTAYSASISIGSGSVSNSQCTFSGAGASASRSGNSLTVNFPLAFAGGYAGAKNIYLHVTDGDGQNSGWVQSGSFTVTSPSSGPYSGPVAVCNGAGTPCVVSLTPTNGSGLSGSFTGVFTRSAGGPALYLGYILFLPTPNIVQYTATGSCLVEYNSISNAMRLVNNAGTNWLPGILGIPLSEGGSLTNNYCTLNVTNSSAVISGTTMTVTADVSFNSGFSGELATFMQGFDVTGAFTGMTQFGNWEVNAGTRKPGPYVVGMSPTSGSGSSATLTFTAGDTRGVSGLAFVTMLVSPAILGAPGCQAFYFPATGTINLVNDSSSAMVSTTGIAPGTAGTLSNSRCSIDTGTASFTSTADDVTVTLPMTFNAGTFGGAKNIYLDAFDDFGDLSDWVTSGTWTVQ